MIMMLTSKIIGRLWETLINFIIKPLTDFHGFPSISYIPSPQGEPEVDTYLSGWELTKACPLQPDELRSNFINHGNSSTFAGSLKPFRNMDFSTFPVFPIFPALKIEVTWHNGCHKDS